MLFIITYHKVGATVGGGKAQFYTVSPAQLERQIEILQSRGLSCLRFEELLRAQTVSDRKFILTFDDGTAGHFEAVLPILQKYGCQGIFFIPTAKLDKPGYLTGAQVKALHAAGHVIGSHSHEHERLEVLPVEKICERIAHSQEILAALIGTKPVIFAAPGGYTNQRVRLAGQSLGIRAMRTMSWGSNDKLDLMALETIPVNRYTDDAKFISLLEARGPSLVYTGKEALKRLIPMRIYELLRGWLYKF